MNDSDIETNEHVQLAADGMARLLKARGANVFTVAELRRALDPEAESRLAEAREAVGEAHSLREQAYLARRGAKDAADLYFGGGGAGGNYWGAAS